MLDYHKKFSAYSAGVGNHYFQYRHDNNDISSDWMQFFYQIMKYDNIFI